MPSGIGPSWLQRLIEGEQIEFPELPSEKPVWEPEPMVVGDKELGREVRALTNKFPGLKKRVKSVTLGPTSGSMEAMINNKLPIGSFGGTNLAGVYGPIDEKGLGPIGINPDFAIDHIQRSHTLGHEFGHAGGLDSELLANAFGDKWRDYYLKNPYASKVR